MERNDRVTYWVKQSAVALIVSLAVLGFAPTALAGGTAAPTPPPVPKPDPPPLPPAKPKPPPVVRHAVTPPPVQHAVVKPAPVAPRPAVTPPPAAARPAFTPSAPTQVVHARRHHRHPAATPGVAPPLMIDRPAAEQPMPAHSSTLQPASASFAGSSSGSGPNWVLSLGILGAAVSLLLLALAAVPGWVVSSPPVARFLDQHRHDFTFTGFAFLTGVVILSATVALSGT